MPRLIILLLPVAALIVLAVQNSTPAIALNFLGGSLPALPFGLLLAIAVALGALVTLVLYGLIGLRRPPESKYKPIGRRVPYPEGPGYSPAPGSSSTGPADTPSYPIGEPTTSYSSSAFVSEPDPRQSAPREPAPREPAPREPAHREPAPPPPATPQDLPRDDSYRAVYEPQSSVSSEPRGSFVDSLKSNLPFSNNLSFTSKKGRSQDQSTEDRSIGDDWGELRTTEQINDWESAKPSVVEEGIDNLFRFGRSAGTNVGRIADDIASGWNNPNQANRPSEAQSEQYYPQPGYSQSGYPQSETYYAKPSDDELDRGWENFDDSYDNPPAGAAKPGSRRTYGDSLYGAEEAVPTHDSYDSEYIDADPEVDEIGPDGVYEADYRVIVPPSKPLDELSDESEDDRYYS